MGLGFLKPKGCHFMWFYFELRQEVMGVVFQNMFWIYPCLSWVLIWWYRYLGKRWTVLSSSRPFGSVLYQPVGPPWGRTGWYVIKTEYKTFLTNRLKPLWTSWTAYRSNRLVCRPTVVCWLIGESTNRSPTSVEEPVGWQLNRLVSTNRTPIDPVGYVNQP